MDTKKTPQTKKKHRKFTFKGRVIIVGIRNNDFDEGSIIQNETPSWNIIGFPILENPPLWEAKIQKFKKPAI